MENPFLEEILPSIAAPAVLTMPEVDAVAGGINPQPLPPREETRE